MEPPSSREQKVLVFQVAGEVCALPLECVQEIVPMALLSRPPGLPSAVEGFLNLGGKAIPVLRLDRLFYLPESKPGLYTPLIILRGTDHQIALLVENVEEVLSINGEALSPIREQYSFNGCATAEAAVGDQAFHLLSPEQIVREQEGQSLAELQAKAQNRLVALPAAYPPTQEPETEAS